MAWKDVFVITFRSDASGLVIGNFGALDRRVLQLLRSIADSDYKSDSNLNYENDFHL